MNNARISVPKKEMTFAAVVLVVLMVMVLLDTEVKILVNYDEQMLQVTSPRLNIDIEHIHVEDIQLMDMPDFGTMVGDSYSHEAYCAGTWNNESWDSYTLCVIPSNRKCILVELVNEGYVVFSCTTDEETETLYHSYVNYLQK